MQNGVKTKGLFSIWNSLWEMLHYHCKKKSHLVSNHREYLTTHNSRVLMSLSYLWRTGGSSVRSSKSSSNWESKSHFIISSFEEQLLFTSHVLCSTPVFTVSGTTQMVIARVKQQTAGLQQSQARPLLKISSFFNTKSSLFSLTQWLWVDDLQ